MSINKQSGEMGGVKTTLAMGRLLKKVRPEAKNWLMLVEEDVVSARILFKSARHPHAIYFYCQAIEKLLKAAQVEISKSEPKKIHDLDRLVVYSGLDFTQDMRDLITILNTHYKRVRYRDLAQAHYNTRAKVKPIINQAEEGLLWMLEQFKRQLKSF